MATRDETLSMIARLREELAALYRAKGGAPADATATTGLQTINTPAMNMQRHTAPPASATPIAAQIAQKEAILLQLSNGLQQGLRLAGPPTGSPGVAPDIGGPVSDQLPPPGGEPIYPATGPEQDPKIAEIDSQIAALQEEKRKAEQLGQLFALESRGGDIQSEIDRLGLDRRALLGKGDEYYPVVADRLSSDLMEPTWDEYHSEWKAGRTPPPATTDDPPSDAHLLEDVTGLAVDGLPSKGESRIGLRSGYKAPASQARKPILSLRSNRSSNDVEANLQAKAPPTTNDYKAPASTPGAVDFFGGLGETPEDAIPKKDGSNYNEKADLALRLLETLGGVGASYFGGRDIKAADERGGESQARANLINALRGRSVAQAAPSRVRPGIGTSLLEGLTMGARSARESLGERHGREMKERGARLQEDRHALDVEREAERIKAGKTKNFNEVLELAGMNAFRKGLTLDEVTADPGQALGQNAASKWAGLTPNEREAATQWVLKGWHTAQNDEPARTFTAEDLAAIARMGAGSEMTFAEALETNPDLRRFAEGRSDEDLGRAAVYWSDGGRGREATVLPSSILGSIKSLANGAPEGSVGNLRLDYGATEELREVWANLNDDQKQEAGLAYHATWQNRKDKNGKAAAGDESDGVIVQLMFGPNGLWELYDKLPSAVKGSWAAGAIPGSKGMMGDNKISEGMRRAGEFDEFRKSVSLPLAVHLQGSKPTDRDAELAELFMPSRSDGEDVAKRKMDRIRMLLKLDRERTLHAKNVALPMFMLLDKDGNFRDDASEIISAIGSGRKPEGFELDANTLLTLTDDMDPATVDRWTKEQRDNLFHIMNTDKESEKVAEEELKKQKATGDVVNYNPDDINIGDN